MVNRSQLLSGEDGTDHAVPASKEKLPDKLTAHRSLIISQVVHDEEHLGNSLGFFPCNQRFVKFRLIINSMILV